MNTLAAMVSETAGSRSTNLPAIAGKVPGGPKGPEIISKSPVEGFGRWLRNKSVESETFFLPFAAGLLVSQCHDPLVLTIDGSMVGRGCMTLMASVIYKQRALPVVRVVVGRKKGHFPE